MTEAVTLSRLQVMFEANYGKFKKDLEQVRAATKHVNEVVAEAKNKINKNFNSVSTGHARVEVDKLRERLKRQQEAVATQTAVIKNLNNQYRDLMEGVTKDSGKASLEKQLASAQKELAKLDAQMQPLLEKLTQAEEFEELGLKMPELDEVRAQLDSLNPKYEELDNLVDHLKQRLDEVRMNPESTTSAEKLREQIALAQAKLERLQDTAAGTERQLDQMMNAGKLDGFKKGIKNITDKIKHMGSTTSGSSTQMNDGLRKVTDGITRMRKRLTGMAASVFVFGLISKGLNSTKESMSGYLKQDAQFNASLSATKNNLQTSFMPIYTTILPYINALMDKLKAMSEYLAVFTSTLFGKTYAQSKKATDQMKALTGGSSSGDGMGLASFDRINNLSSGASSGSSGGIVGNIVSPEAETDAKKLVDLLEKLKSGTEAFRNACKRLWSEGLSKLGKFSWTGLKDFWDYFLKPFGKWAFGTNDKGLTRLVDIINNDLNGVPWEEINENLKDFWIAIEPYAEEFGEGLIDFIEDVSGVGTDALTFLFGDSGIMPKVTDWLNEGDPESARLWGYGLGVLAASILTFSALSNIATAISQANQLLSVLGGLKGLGKIALVVTVAYAGFEGGKELGKMLFPDDKELYDEFKFTGEGGFFDYLSQDWGSCLDGLVLMTEDFSRNSGILVWLELKDKIVEAFGDLGADLEETLNTVPDALKTVFTNGANAGIEIFNKFIDRVNEKMHFEWDAIKILGKEVVGAGSVQLFTIPKIPKLAKGGIATSAMIAQIGEAGREAVLPLENNTGWMKELSVMLVDALKHASAGEHSQNGGGEPVYIYLEGDAAKLFKLIRDEDAKFYRRTRRSAFAH